ncbi:MAG: hypothetical protein WC397_01465 [Candidatus Paceibacterota bacterium]|jgi:hypothetical protein
MSIVKIIITSTVLFALSILVYYIAAREFFNFLLEKNALTYWFLIFFAVMTFGNYEIDMRKKYGISSGGFILIPLLGSKKASSKEKFLYVLSFIFLFAFMMGFAFLYVYPTF